MNSMDDQNRNLSATGPDKAGDFETEKIATEKNQAACDIARDLMALEIESLCSPAGAALVGQHVARCDECAQIYQTLRAKTPEPLSPEQGNPSFPQAFGQLLRTIRFRQVMALIAGALLAALMILLCASAYTNLFEWSRKNIPVDAITYTLARMSDGAVLETMDTGRFECLGWEGRYSDDGSIAYIQPMTTILRLPWVERATMPRINYEDLLFEEGVLYRGGPDFDRNELAPWNPRLTVIRELRLGTPDGEWRTVYKQGDDIPLCAPELQAQWESIVRRQQSQRWLDSAYEAALENIEDPAASAEPGPVDLELPVPPEMAPVP